MTLNASALPPGVVISTPAPTDLPGYDWTQGEPILWRLGHADDGTPSWIEIDAHCGECRGDIPAEIFDDLEVDVVGYIAPRCTMPAARRLAMQQVGAAMPGGAL